MSQLQRSPIVTAGIFLGVGLGSFIDGILLHQVLQWHNMLSSRVPPIDLVSMKYNMIWDGLFHVFSWLMTAVGVGLLWRAGGQRERVYSGRMFGGALALGWGLFNFVEGVIDHELLGLHHVHGEVNQLAWDLGFLALGAALIGIGAVAIRGPRSQR